MKKILFNSGGHSAKTSIGLLLIRLSVGGMMIYYHGWVKLINYKDLAKDFSDPLGMGSSNSLVAAFAAEVLCSFLIIIGLMTRWTSFGLVFTMGVAAFAVHGGAIDKIELALMYLIASLGLMFTGAGKFSLDASISK